MKKKKDKDSIKKKKRTKPWPEEKKIENLEE